MSDAHPTVCEDLYVNVIVCGMTRYTAAKTTQHVVRRRICIRMPYGVNARCTLNAVLSVAYRASVVYRPSNEYHKTLHSNQRYQRVSDIADSVSVRPARRHRKHCNLFKLPLAL